MKKKILLLSDRPTDETYILENIISEQIKKYKGYVPTGQLSQHGSIDSVRTICKGNDVIAIFIGIEWIKQHLPSLDFLKKCIEALHQEILDDLPQIFICLERNILEINNKNLSGDEQRLKAALTTIKGMKNVIVCSNHHNARTTFIEFYKNREVAQDEKPKEHRTRKESIL